MGEEKEEAKFCSECGHSINDHRMLLGSAPGKCMFVIRDEKGFRKNWCPCDQFKGD